MIRLLSVLVLTDVPSAQEYNELKFTVAVATVFGDNAEVIVDDIGIPK